MSDQRMTYALCYSKWSDDLRDVISHPDELQQIPQIALQHLCISGMHQPVLVTMIVVIIWGPCC